MRKFKFLLTFALLVNLLVLQVKITAHGYVISPASRNYQGSLDKIILGYSAAAAKYGAIINEPQSLEFLKGFPAQGPADGHIASANGILGDYVLDQQSSDRWTKTNITSGINSFTWKYTAYHNTAKWHYYMTKPNWNPNQPITRADLELIGTINHNGTPPADNSPHQITIPSDRQGYHVILAVWDIDDTLNAFYNVIDVNVTSSPGGSLTAPNIPTGLNSENITSTSAKISWAPQSNATSFIIFRNDIAVQETSNNFYQDFGLSQNTNYTYRVQAKGATGLLSAQSAPIMITTSQAGSVEIPTAPSLLHTMATTDNNVSLMWGPSSHSQGIMHYQIFRDNIKIAEVTQTSYVDNGLLPDNEYQYFVQAVSQTEKISNPSNLLIVKTKKESSGAQTYCGVEVYNSANSYPTANSQVFYNCRIWKNKWYANPNELPGTDMVWEEVGVCAEAPNCSNSQPILHCGFNEYNASLSYPNAGTKVYYKNHIWENKWYANSGEIPGEDMVWKLFDSCNESTNILAKITVDRKQLLQIVVADNHIKFYPETLRDEITRVRVYDARGLLMVSSSNVSVNGIDISKLQRGIYHLNIETSGKESFQKTIKN